MKQDDQTFADFVRVLRRRSRAAAFAALAVLLGMTLVIFLLPTVYESTATLLIEHPDVPPEVTGAESLDGYVEQRLQRVRQRVMTNENVKALIKQHNVYSTGESSHLSLDDQIIAFKESVLVTPEVTGIIDPRSMRSADLTYAFGVSFRHSDPIVAKRVADALAELFITSNATRAKDISEKTITFLRSEASRLESDLRSRENRLAEFRQSVPGGLPENEAQTLQRAADIERDIARLDDDLRAAQARRALLETQLRDTPRDRAVIDETGQPVIRGSERLAIAQQELVAALAKYSEDHPDVRKLRREIASLSADPSTSSSAPPTNPAYLQLETQVNAAYSEVRDLTARRNGLSASLSQLRASISQSPLYEKQYKDLIRDYEVIKAQYDQIRARQAEAEVGLKASDAHAAENYILIDPASEPTQPVEPDRVALTFLAIVLAAAAGLGTATVLNAADTTVRGDSDVLALAGVTPLGHIPLMRNAAEIRRDRAVNLAIGAGFLTAGIGVMLAVI